MVSMGKNGAVPPGTALFTPGIGRPSPGRRHDGERLRPGGERRSGQGDVAERGPAATVRPSFGVLHRVGDGMLFASLEQDSAEDSDLVLSQRHHRSHAGVKVLCTTVRFCDILKCQRG